MAGKSNSRISEAPKSGIETCEELVSRAGALSNIYQRIGGIRGSFITGILYGPDHIRKISLLGWSGTSRKKRLAKHRASIAKARAVLKEIREARKQYGANWQLELFRQRILRSEDPKAALRKIPDGNFQ